MDFAQIRYFLTLADTLNFTRAAERCGVTQPTLTQSIKRLEDELGGQLLIRAGKHTRLSQLGRALKENFDQVEAARRELEQVATAISGGERATLNIGVACTIGPAAIEALFERLKQRHPGVMLTLFDVAPGDAATSLLDGRLDACFCCDRGPGHDRLDVTPLYEEPLVVAFPAGHRFERYDVVPLEEVVREPFLARRHCELRDELLSFCARVGQTLKIVVSAHREDWIQTRIRAGAGVSIVPKDALIVPEIGWRPLAGEGMSRQIQLVTSYGGPKSAPLRGLVTEARRFDWRMRADAAPAYAAA